MCAAPLHREIGGNSFSEFLEKYSVFVSKADFKFNAAHFVAYEGFREKLHGHNYTVAVHCEAEGIQADGYVVDFGDIKAVVRKLCKELNELFLCPKNSDVLDISIADNVLRIKCQDGAEFTFPASDAAMLPIKHSTVEELSKYFCERIIKEFTTQKIAARNISSIRVCVSEAPGQEAQYTRKFLSSGVVIKCCTITQYHHFLFAPCVCEPVMRFRWQSHTKYDPSSAS